MMMMMLLQLRRSITTIRSHNKAIAAAVCFRNISTITAAAASSSVQVPNKMKTKTDMPTVKKTKKDTPTVAVTQTTTTTTTTTTTSRKAAKKKEEEQDSEYEFRDFSPLGVAHMILFTVRQLPTSTMSTLCQVLDGNIVAPHKYPRSTNPLRVQTAIQKFKNEMNLATTTTYTSGYYQDVMQLLIQQGYIKETHRKMKHSHITLSSYKLSIQGQSALDDTSRPILLPVTEAIQTREQQERAQRQTMIQQLQQNGINLQQIQAMEEQYSFAPCLI
jgi:hypothetical protein